MSFLIYGYRIFVLFISTEHINGKRTLYFTKFYIRRLVKKQNPRKLVSNEYKVVHSNVVYGSKRHITFTPIFKFNVGTT